MIGCWKPIRRFRASTPSCSFISAVGRSSVSVCRARQKSRPMPLNSLGVFRNARLSRPLHALPSRHWAFSIEPRGLGGL